MIARGEYDSVAQVVWDVTEADALLVLVVNGERGSGYSVKGSLDLIAELPAILREIADEIDGAPGRRALASTADLDFLDRHLADDAREWPAGHPCRDCGALAGHHPTERCEAWR